MASVSGSIEGYLIKLEQDSGEIVYCILEEGNLVYYSGKGGDCLGQLTLTGHRINVNLIRDDRDSVPNRFIVSSRPPKKDEMENRLLFSASTPECQENWATAILNWNKHCWDDSETVFSYKDELEALKRIVNKYNLKQSVVIHPIG
ncbi:hypothetical protein THRCLA_23105 [Thraustotheca clavata]|uniref:PH domain-containing protein n=1 Tax=Thraustotheca clavata TaxID=74557 RepID=A0A1V9YE55_9STRA|nr:hypothetical protein THRCLA_23105 [Thraustotheca clavata]